ncbi:MAG: ABC transporter permease [Planctomycetes bacterium]|nr:ABC transporter permease [Planctomycetota bacterium]
MNELFEVVITSLQVSGISLVIAALMAIPLGAVIGLSNFRGKKLVLGLVNTGMGLPPILVGLVVALLLWRSGPLGFLGLLYSRTAIIIAQTVIAIPIITAFVMVGLQKIDPELIQQTTALGATRWQMFIILVREAKLALLTAVMAGFGGIISEVGAVMMVGGNIKGDTRVLTTGILLETRMGNFNTALVMGLVLLMISFVINLTLTIIQQKDSRQ